MPEINCISDRVDITIQLTDRDEGVLVAMHRAVGFGASFTSDVSAASHVGSITVSLIDSGMREVSAKEIVNRWRQRAGEFPGTDVLVFSTGPRGPAAAPIEITLLASSHNIDQLRAAVDQTSDRLNEYPGRVRRDHRTLSPQYRRLGKCKRTVWQPSIFSDFKQAGYTTAMIGKPYWLY